MFNLPALAYQLDDTRDRHDLTDIRLAQQTGLTRQSVRRALSGQHNFGVTSLLALADALDLEVMLVPKAASQALGSASPAPGQAVPSLVDALKTL